jgi:ankyrin repeat protein
MNATRTLLVSILLGVLFVSRIAVAQVAPSSSEVAAYRGLHAAAAKGDTTEIARLVKAGSPIDARDSRARTPLHVATYMRRPDAARALMRLGADPNALEAQQYDIVTIAAVANDVPMLKVALEGGCKATNVTSPYQGTALIAAAHLGHDEVVRILIAAKAPLDHVNNLGWTALIDQSSSVTAASVTPSPSRRSSMQVPMSISPIAPALCRSRSPRNVATAR